VLLLDSFDIEHIIPENILERPDEWIELKKELGLDDGFDINGYENLVPARRRINGNKGATVLPKRALMYFLSFSMEKKKIVETFVEDFEKQSGIEKARHLIAKALECNEVTKNDVVNFADQARFGFTEISKNILAQYPELEFDLFNAEVLSEFRKKAISDPVTLVDSSGNELIVSTCEEYSSCINKGYAEKNNYDIKMASKLRCISSLINFISAAGAPSKSLIHQLGLCDISMMCASMFPDLSGECNYKNKYKTYQGLVSNGNAKIMSIGTGFIHIENNLMGQYIVEVCRGCFDDKKYEQMLVFEYSYAIEGTFSYANARLISRLRKTSKMAFVD
ncbi:hypothetical protein LC013_002055, partial [Salmonella enterica subsp. enterica serovar Mbandaka]|nr:hypothetical protein [Salmonella enterica subsp. enterica serovar Mbandaka]